jgi:hypothetical protein
MAKARVPNLDIFERIANDAIAADQFAEQSEHAINWYNNKTRDVGRQTRPNSIVNMKRSYGTDLGGIIGKLFIFRYEPKGKKTLPYYDRYPLVFPIEMKSRPSGFLGINMHYLFYKHRGILMHNLYSILSSDEIEDSSRLQLSYDFLKFWSAFKYVKPTIKRYITSHINSSMVEIQPTDWNTAIFLPIEQFEGASKRSVWAKSSYTTRRHG